MEKLKLSVEVCTLLLAHGIRQEDILQASKTDMNTECEYADGYVLLTGKQLAVVSSPPDRQEVRRFKGCSAREDTGATSKKEWTVRLYPVCRIKMLFLENQVACGILTAQTEDGEAIRLAAFSNLYKRQIHRLVRGFEHISGERPLTGEEEQAEEEYCPVCGMMYPNRNRKVCPRCMDRSSVFLRILGYFRPFAGKIVIMFFSYLAIAGLNLFWPYLSGTILYDKVLVKNTEFLKVLRLLEGRFILALFLVILMMFLVKLTLLALSMLQGVFTAQIVALVVRNMKKDIFEAMGRLSISFFRSRQTGSLMTRVLDDADQVTGFFLDGAPYIVIHAFTLLASIIVMFAMRWEMALAACLLLPVSFGVSLYLRPRLFSLFGRRHRAQRAVNGQVNDNLTGARVVKAFGQEEKELSRFRKNNSRLKDAEISIVRFDNYFNAIYTISQEMAVVIVWLIGVTLLLKEGNLELGELITFVGYVAQMAGPMNFFSKVFRWWSNSMNSAQRMFEILDAVPEVLEDENPVYLENPRGEIELKNVTFGYEANKPVLKDVSVHIPEGKMLGIVGRSGAGKTTLVNLISRLYDPQEGAIYFDGIDIRRLPFQELRRNVAMVSQETYIFMGTVAENIKYARPDATKAEIIRAAILASAHDFILRMPDGYDTVIGSSGRELSGGERQRISIARAILADPKILILDEATASVDTETERAIQASINYLVKGRTTISIAHRLSTLRDADFLIVIDNGEIRERGSQRELEQEHGIYYKLLELQRKALALKGLE